MADASDDNREQVRERFTRTAEQFAKFSLTTRNEEARLLVDLAAPQGTERALDLACGAGTFALAFAPHVQFVAGVDLTPAMLAGGRRSAADAGIANTVFVCGDAASLPFADASVDIAACAYSLHHIPDPGRVLQEMRRVAAHSGRIAVVDLIAPPEPERAAANNAIERARDASHATTLRLRELRALAEAAGLRIRTWQITHRLRSFDDWMRIAGWQRGDGAYEETRRLMESSMPRDTAGFHPRLVASDIEFLQTSAFLIAER